MSLAGQSAAVVGGGFGGLAAACYLADAGADVTILEKNDSLGGRASVLERDGFRFDMGPSWYLMPDVFERFFDHFDREPTDYYDLEHLDPHYRVFFKDGDGADHRVDGHRGGPVPGGDVDVVDMSGDLDHVTAVFEAYEDGAGDAVQRYLDEAADSYEVGMERFVYEDRTDVSDYLSLDVARSARGLSLLGSMEDHVAGYFDHPKLRQLVQYSLVFLGGSPSNTPALYNLMSHVDFGLGVYYPEGGMGGVVDGIAALASELDVEVQTGAPVEGIDPHAREFVVRTADGQTRADTVVSDAGYPHTEQSLLAPEYRQYDADHWADQTWAPSAFLLYLGVEGDLDPLAHHNLVLPSDWGEHFDAIFERPRWPADPAYYVCAPSVTDDGVAPDGHANLFVLVPVAPGLDDGADVRDRYRDRVLADLADNAGVDVRDRVVVEERFAVSEFADRYNSYRGTALGLAHTLDQTAVFRPPRRSAAVDGLYFVGADTNPGIGVPMCLISGELTAERLQRDYGDAGR
ncbi:MAG: phytoene desaturase family protein [Halobacteriaceae archaeon]